MDPLPARMPPLTSGRGPEQLLHDQQAGEGGWEADQSCAGLGTVAACPYPSLDFSHSWTAPGRTQSLGAGERPHRRPDLFLVLASGCCWGPRLGPCAPPCGSCTSWALSLPHPSTPRPTAGTRQPNPDLSRCRKGCLVESSQGSRNPITALHPPQPPGPRPDPVTASMIPAARSTARPPTRDACSLCHVLSPKAAPRPQPTALS